MLIGGLQKTSLIDYPDRVSCIVFTVGCNFRCPFCQNSELVTNTKHSPLISEEYFFSFLESRKGLLDAVVITGGEPLMQKDMESFLKRVKSMGFLVKLDTNGSFPDILERMIKKRLVDYVAMDVKSSQEKYGRASGVEMDIGKVRKSVEVIMKSGVDYEFRTTAVPGIHSKEDFIEIGRWLRGAKKYYIQKFSNEKTLDSRLSEGKPFTEGEAGKICESIRNLFGKCELRGYD